MMTHHPYTIRLRYPVNFLVMVRVSEDAVELPSRPRLVSRLMSWLRLSGEPDPLWLSGSYDCGWLRLELIEVEDKSLRWPNSVDLRINIVANVQPRLQWICCLWIMLLCLDGRKTWV
jgi:hypothetical protein